MNDATLHRARSIKIEDYAYELPAERVARFPLERREDARLLILDEEGIRESYFRDMPVLLREGDTLVFNNTRVIRARLLFHRESGARVEIFCLEPAEPEDYALNLASGSGCEWHCMVGNARRWKGETLGREGALRATRVGGSGDSVRVRFEWDAPLSFGEMLEINGQVPLPPYLGREAAEEDRERYQTVYSSRDGSVAAPTAGLHFSRELMERAREAGARLQELTLHVGAGTFKPVKAERFGDHEMHTERVSIPRALVDALINAPGRAIAVGTTTTRSLESLYWMGVKRLLGRADFRELGQWEAYALPRHRAPGEALEAIARYLDDAGEASLEARSTLAIVPGYDFRVVSDLFTNFHQPRSTLLLLVAAAVGEEWRAAYDHALAGGFRFLSYGDGCFLHVKK